MTSEPELLIEKLDELILFLDSYGETHWRRWIARSVEILRTGDLYGVQYFLGAFGGMGSINDFVITTRHGDSLTESEVRAADEHFRRILGEAWSLASSIRRKGI